MAGADDVPFVLDTNGSRGPNVLSNCVATQEGADDSDADLATCDTRADRVIGDQFQLRLNGNVVEPVGAAAQWAFNN